MSGAIKSKINKAMDTLSMRDKLALLSDLQAKIISDLEPAEKLEITAFTIEDLVDKTGQNKSTVCSRVIR